MATSSAPGQVQHAAAVLVVVIAVAAAAYDHEAQSLAQGQSAVGSSLAQGPVTLIEQSSSAAGSSLAQGPMKFRPAPASDVTLSDPTSANSQYFQQLSDPMAGLDDIFDDQKVEPVQAEVEEFSTSKLLGSPSLYFTIALLITGGLLLTSTWNQDEQPQQPQQPQQPLQQPQLTPQAKAAAAAGRRLQQQQQQQQQQTPQAQAPSKKNVTAAANIPNIPAISALATANLSAASEADEAKASGTVGHEELSAAADACRAGEANSYASFCRLLASHGSAQ